MNRVFFLICGIVFLGSCNLIPSERSNFCLTCHRTEGVYKNLDLAASYHVDYREKRKDCIRCHLNKGVTMFVEVNALYVKNFFKNFTKIQLFNGKVLSETDYDESCLFCHSNVLEKNEVDISELPLELSKIGLKYDHKIHVAYKNFSSEDKKNLNTLKKKSNLSAEEIKELELLKKREKANCAECHEKIKVNEKGKNYEDKNINYLARNPMLCTACHYDINLWEHPGKKSKKLPSEESCRRCHDGKLHGGNLKVFLADCEKGEDKTICLKCHPYYLPGKL